MTAERMLTHLYIDVHNDVCGRLRGFSNLCYIHITIQMIGTFVKIDSECQDNKNPMSKLSSRGDAESPSKKRLLLALNALRGKDEELLKSMAAVFQNCLPCPGGYLYWEAEDEDKEETNHGPMMGDFSPDCCVM